MSWSSVSFSVKPTVCCRVEKEQNSLTGAEIVTQPTGLEVEDSYESQDFSSCVFSIM